MTRGLVRFAVKRYPLRVTLIAVLMALSPVMGAVGLGTLLPILESIGSPGNPPLTHPVSKAFASALAFVGAPVTLWSLMVLLLSLILGRAALDYLRRVTVAKTQALLMLDLRTEIFSTLVDSPLSFFHREKVGDLANVGVTEVDRSTAAFNHLIGTLVAGGTTAAYVLIGFAVSWELTLAFAVIAFPLYYLTRKRQTITGTGEDLTDANDRFQSTLVELLSGVREVKLFNLHDQAMQDFEDAAGSVSRLQYNLNRSQARYQFAYRSVAVGLLLAITGLVVFVIPVSVAEMGAFFVIMFRLTPSLNGITKKRDKYLGTIPGWKAVRETLDGTRAPHVGGHDSGSRKFRRLDDGITLDDVTFVYPGTDEPALQRVDAVIPAGQTTALVGESGAGKSTLVDLVAGFHEPTEGAVLVDGTDLREIDIESWREALGFVSQDTFLFHESVRENIRRGRLDAKDEEIVEAAKRAHAHHFIEDLEDGYDTVIGDRGVRLSGGQRQRLALARAALRDPQILILDEATSDLDSRSEAHIQEAMAELTQDKTVIVIAHRLSTVRDADQILVLDEGKVAERGPHRDLLDQKGVYAELHERQFDTADVEEREPNPAESSPVSTSKPKDK